MGLDVSYYRNAQPIQPPVDIQGDDIWEWRDETGAVKYYALEGFEDRLDGIDAQWVIGEYVGGFAAGSYGGYNRFRRLLSHIILGVEPDVVWKEPERFAGRPFIELINFADNEGCIGPKASAKLAEDFRQHREVFVNHPDVGLWAGKYDEWAKAFEAAAQDGCVGFH